MAKIIICIDELERDFRSTQRKKTESLQDLLNWIKSQPSLRKKEVINTKIDKIVYGVNR